eukprot:gene8679-7619_t
MVAHLQLRKVRGALRHTDAHDISGEGHWCRFARENNLTFNNIRDFDMTKLLATDPPQVMDVVGLEENPWFTRNPAA